MYVYVYMYICTHMCVCVRVCVWQLIRKSAKGSAPGVQLRATFGNLTGKLPNDLCLLQHIAAYCGLLLCVAVCCSVL